MQANEPTMAYMRRRRENLARLRTKWLIRSVLDQLPACALCGRKMPMDWSRDKCKKCLDWKTRRLARQSANQDNWVEAARGHKV